MLCHKKPIINTSYRLNASSNTYTFSVFKTRSLGSVKVPVIAIVLSRTLVVTMDVATKVDDNKLSSDSAMDKTRSLTF